MSRPIRPLAASLIALATLGCNAPRANFPLAGTQATQPLPTLAALGAAPASLAVPNNAGPSVATDHLIVALAAGVTPSQYMASITSRGFRQTGDLILAKRHVLKVSLPAGMSLTDATRLLAKAPGAHWVQQDHIVHPTGYSFTNEDPKYPQQWAHQAAHADTIDAWPLVPAASQSKVIVAILDTGLDVNHPEFSGRVISPDNYVTADGNASDVTDYQGHGTHVAGIIGAAGDNGIGVAGVAWGVKLMPIKVVGQSGGSDDYTIVQAILRAVDFGVDPATGARVRVINMSLGSSSRDVSPLYKQAIDEARAAGIVVVVAAGNDGRGSIEAPANTPGCIAVGSTTNELGWETLSGFSDYGAGLDLVAPGSRIMSTFPTAGSNDGTNYGVESGTSMASPFVAGVAALVTARYDPNGTNANATFADEVRARLDAAVDDLGVPGWDPIYGYGRINAYKAVSPANITPP